MLTCAVPGNWGWDIVSLSIHCHLGYLCLPNSYVHIPTPALHKVDETFNT